MNYYCKYCSFKIPHGSTMEFINHLEDNHYDLFLEAMDEIFLKHTDAGGKD